MSGVRLLELDSKDLVDVLHYMFEDDTDFHSPEAAEARDKLRTLIYEDLYFKKYEYAAPSSSKKTYILDEPLDLDEPPIQQFDPSPMKKATKAYTPPTNFNPDAQNPYHGVLDAPLG